MRGTDVYEHFGVTQDGLGVGDAGVGWFRVIGGIYVASRRGFGRGEIDVNSEERSQACGQMLSA